MAAVLKRVAAAVLAAYGASAVPAAAHAPAPVADYAEIDRYLETNQRQMHIPGMQLVVLQGDQVVHRRGFGRADQSGRPMTTDTPMVIASISKPIAASAVMLLVEQGKLDLDAPITSYLPWFRMRSAEGGAGVTVRHLLSQTSGIPRHAGYPPILDPRVTLEAAVRDLPRYETTGAPGERFVYSNSNFAALGLLVETVSGQSYAEFVTAHILKPLGMTRTYFSESEARAAGLAQGYTATFGFPLAVNHPFLPHATPYYQLVSTADDLARFVVPFLNQGRAGDIQFLSPQSVKEMLTPYQPGSNYGLGWWTSTFHGVPAISHGGDAHGFRNELVILPDRGAAVILLTNENSRLTASWPFSVLAWSTAARLMGQPWWSPVASFRWRTAMVSVAVLVFVVSFIAWLALLAGWRARVIQGELSFLAGLWLPGLVSAVVGAVTLRYGPRLFDHGNWAIGLPTQPDLAWTGLVWSTGLLLSGLYHLAAPWLARFLPKG